MNLSVFVELKVEVQPRRTMAPKRRGSANTNVGESSNPGTMQEDQLAKMIQGYEEKNNATVEMMMEMRKMFKEKVQALEKENNTLKQNFGKSGNQRLKGIQSAKAERQEKKAK